MLFRSLKSEYQDILERLDALEHQGIIGAFDKRTIIELSNDVMKSITRKFENIQKGMGDIMRGALIETEARRLKDQAEKENARKTAQRMLKRGKLTIDEIADYSGLTVTEVEQLKEHMSELLTV